MPEQILIADLQKQINVIALRELLPLMEAQQTVKKLFEVSKRRGKEDVSELLESVGYCYSAAVVVAICRQTDRDPQSDSLLNLLMEVFLNASKISKKWFVEQYATQHQEPARTAMRGLGTSDFEKKFGAGEYVDPLLVHQDIECLLDGTRDIRKFRNKAIAHRDKVLRKTILEIDQAKVEDALLLTKRLVLKYYFLLFQAELMLDTDGLSHEWVAIFDE